EDPDLERAHELPGGFPRRQPVPASRRGQGRFRREGTEFRAHPVVGRITGRPLQFPEPVRELADRTGSDIWTCADPPTPSWAPRVLHAGHRSLSLILADPIPSSRSPPTPVLNHPVSTRMGNQPRRHRRAGSGPYGATRG